MYRGVMRRLAFLLGVSALACSVLVAAGSAEPGASRIVDRTFLCETGYLGGVYQATVESYWYVPPQAGRRIPSGTVSTNLTEGFLGGISPSSMSVNREHCTPTRAKLSLTTTGMRGGPFSPLSTEYDCYTPRRVLLRIRGDFVKPTTLRTASPFGYPQLQAQGAAKQTALAVGTLAGKLIAYASIAGAKKARLFTSTNCQED
jgi:fluoride ion exporter CrcB/FEX